MMVVTLLIAATVDFKAHFQLLLAMVVLNNVFCATQDVAIDSLAVSTLQADERGRANGLMFGGQYFGIALGGGGAMFVNGTFGFAAALASVAGLLLLNLLFVLIFVRDPCVDPTPPARQHGAFRRLVRTMVSFVKEVYGSFWQSGRGPKIGVAFAVTLIDYVQNLRIEEAKRLLESTSVAAEGISARVGYEDASLFRRLFRRRTGLTPVAYRRLFKPARVDNVR